MQPNLQLKIIVGAPASGKSERLLADLRGALRRRDWRVRLLVPTATMAEHVRNQLARDGLLLRKTTVSTLTRYVEDLGLSTRAPDAATLERVIAGVIAERCPAEYLQVGEMAGFVRHVAKSLDALSLAGVEAPKVEGGLGDLFARVRRALEARGLALRGDRLGEAAKRVKDGERLLLDGFFSFAAMELVLLRAIAERGELTISLPETVEAARTIAELETGGAVVERLAGVYREPANAIGHSANREQEVLQIARRILELVRGGVELRRIGVLLRKPGIYAPLIDSTFTRLGIASRSYLGQDLSRHPVAAFFGEFLQAVDADWDLEAVLRALRWRLTGLGGDEEGDALENAAREALPGQGQGLGMFSGVLPQLSLFAGWAASEFSPVEACRELKRLRVLLRAPRDLQPTLEEAWRWKQVSSALEQIERVLDETVVSFEADARVRLSEFWRAAESSLAEITLRERDTRRNVVHVMDLFESRQWELDYVFAPGMVEGEFPARAAADPLLTESMRRNFGMKTMEDRQAEELFLFAMLQTRARVELRLSYPRTNEKGDPVMPSLFLARAGEKASRCEVLERPAAFVEGAGQVARNYRKPGPWSASEFEEYLGCPWRHFASRGLKLRGLPELPGERLNFLLLGTVVHQAIKVWTLDTAQDIERIGERELERACRRARVPQGYQLERERINVLRNLRLYARNAPPVPGGWEARLEEGFELELDGVAMKGRIDRYDLSPAGEVQAFDYKYSKAKDFAEVHPIQGALYTLALSAKPEVQRVARFTYVALREEARPVVMEEQTLAASVTVAKQTMKAIVESVRSGAVPVAPVDRKLCEYCDFHDACRIRLKEVEMEEAEQAEGAAE